MAFRLFRFTSVATTVACLALGAHGCTSEADDSPEPGTGGTAGTGGTDAGTQGDADASAGSGGTGTQDGAPDSGDLSCLNGALSAETKGTTVGGVNRFSPTCSEGNAPDLAFEWTAPATDYYWFDTVGSSFNTVIALMKDDCRGAELACNDDKTATSARVPAYLKQGERVIVVVDGAYGASGEAVVHVSPVTCPEIDVSGETFPMNLATVGGIPDSGVKSTKSVRFRASKSALYRFTVTPKKSYQRVGLRLERGGVCGGELLQTASGEWLIYVTPVQVARRLDAGEVVTLSISSDETATDSEFALDIAEVNGQCPAQGPLTTPLTDAVLNAETGARTLTSSCNPYGPYTSSNQFPEHSYPLHIALEPNGYCTYTVTSTSSSFVLSLIQGSRCEGPELICVKSDTYNRAALNFTASSNGDYVLVVETTGGIGDGEVKYTVAKTCP